MSTKPKTFRVVYAREHNAHLTQTETTTITAPTYEDAHAAAFRQRGSWLVMEVTETEDETQEQDTVHSLDLSSHRRAALMRAAAARDAMAQRRPRISANVLGIARTLTETVTNPNSTPFDVDDAVTGLEHIARHCDDF